MKSLLQKIEQLEASSRELDPPAQQREKALKLVQQFSESFLSNAHLEKGYFNNGDPMGLGINGQPHELNDLLEKYKNEISSNGIQAASAAHLGYIPGGGIYSAALSDFLAAVTNEYAGMYYASPGAVTVENEVIEWLKEVFLFPSSTVGNLASGGSIANLIALTAARDFHQIKKDKIERSVIYMSSHVHHCIHKALRIIGLEDVIVRELELDDHFKINSHELEARIKEDIALGLYPFLTIASAGTTDTGAIDPLAKIGEIAHSHSMWYHIDGAYGGFFNLLESRKKLFQGIELADSLVVDPHKGLFLPYGVGAVLIKNKEAVFQSHHYTANYMQDALGSFNSLNPADLSPELSKHFRGLRVWLPLQWHGVQVFKDCLEEKLLLTEYARIELERIGMLLGPIPDLSVTFFWHPKGDEATAKLMELIHLDGDVFLSSSVIDNKKVIRVAILAFRTKKDTIDRMVAMVQRCLTQL